MQEADFLQLDDRQVAERLRAAAPPCWSLALGGTRRAYIARGGTLTSVGDLDAYFRWVEAAQRGLLEHLYRLGVETIITVGRVATDRGQDYRSFAARTILSLAEGDERRSFYQRLGLRVAVAGDMAALGEALGDQGIAEQLRAVTDATARNAGPRLVYLFRGDWIDSATEEATLGYNLGAKLGRAPDREEIVRAFYGAELPPLTVYIGSGRPQLGRLRPPFLTGGEDLYWSQHSPLLLTAQDWRRIIYDHLYTRRTRGARGYSAHTHAQIQATIMSDNHGILGVGRRNPAGFWEPILKQEHLHGG